MRYSVGDVVVVGDVRDCGFGHNREMLELKGQEVVITGIYDDDLNKGYFIAEDNGKWVYDDSCFTYCVCREEGLDCESEDLIDLIKG